MEPDTFAYRKDLAIALRKARNKLHKAYQSDPLNFDLYDVLEIDVIRLEKALGVGPWEYPKDA